MSGYKRQTERQKTVAALFRGLPLWLSAYEMGGPEEVTAPDGEVWNIHDLLTLYRRTKTDLPTRQGEAIRIMLVNGLKEDSTAVVMGIKKTSPVGSYATSGIAKIEKMAA